MTHISNDLKRALRNAALASGVLLCGATAWAGNIPQYKLSQGTEKYKEFTDGTTITCNWKGGDRAIFPDGSETLNAYTAQGFPLGFNFRLGGTEFDQFVVTYRGELILGKGQVAYGGNAFRLGMTITKSGLSGGKFSYKTTGTEGNHVFQLQIKNAVVNEAGTSKGVYSLQIRLYEATGNVEIAFREQETVYTAMYGFDTGLHGWDAEDALQLTAPTLRDFPTISEYLKCDLLVPASYIGWDEEDYDVLKSVVYVLSPDMNTVAPTNAPANLVLSQDDDKLNISVNKGEDADATVVLISETPFTDADMPEDGKTFPVGSTIGNAKVLYYGNAQSMSATYNGLEPGKTYYVRAISANGYPAFANSICTEQVFSASHAAPNALVATPATATEITLNCEAEHDIIVAATTRREEGWGKGYVGTFGRPYSTTQVGDVLGEGGTVIYVGRPGEFTCEVAPNELTFFRAWTIDGANVSATAIDAYGAPEVSIPYAPAVETWPAGIPLEEGWSSNGDAENPQYIPLNRAYWGDAAIRATSIENSSAILKTPTLDLSRPSVLTFEYAMETVRSSMEGIGALNMGNEAGKFGDDGALTIYADRPSVKTITEYNGTMTACPDGFESGSSTFETVTVEIPALTDASRITFEFHTPGTSYLYIRNFKIEYTAVPIGAPLNLTVIPNEENGTFNVMAQRHEGAASTLMMVSEGPFYGELEHGRTYAAGETVGNATVFYHDTHSDIATETHQLDSGKQYTVTAASADAAGQWHNEFATAMAVPTGVDVLVTEHNAEAIYTLTGIRCRVSNVNDHPAGVYVRNGKKLVITK